MMVPLNNKLLYYNRRLAVAAGELDAHVVKSRTVSKPISTVRARNASPTCTRYYYYCVIMRRRGRSDRGREKNQIEKKTV